MTTKKKTPVELLETYAGLSTDELAAHSDEILDEYQSLKPAEGETPDAEDAARIIALGAALGQIREEKVVAMAVEAEAAADLANALAELDGPEDEPTEEEPAEEEPAEEEAPAEELELEPVTAAAKPRPRAGAVRRAAAVVEPAAPEDVEQGPNQKLTITIGPDVRDFAAGAEVETISELTRAFTARAKAFPAAKKNEFGANGRTDRFQLATIERPHSLDVVRVEEKDGPEAVFSKIMDVAGRARSARSVSQLKAITAAAGWITPSENFYDFCVWETVEGLLQLPKIQVDRGGINFTKGPLLSDIQSDGNGHFGYTESQLEAGPTKPFLALAAPTWTDVRLDAYGHGTIFPIPLRNSFPELIERYMELSLVAYTKYINSVVIQKVLGYLGAPINFVEHGSAASDLLESLVISRLALVYKYSLAFAQVVTVILPLWAKEAVKVDLSRRNAFDDAFMVTDAMIDGWFSERFLDVQYVRDWAGQDLAGTTTAFPAAISFGMWVPGTFVQGGDEIISLDAVYDSTGLANNTYIGDFFEESLLVANTCGQGVQVTTGLNYYGQSGAADLGRQTGS